MKIDRVLELLKIERECVTRQSPCNEKSKLCDRNCGECDIAQNDLELIEMYDFVISMIETLNWRSQWISVKDRLPERSGDVLVCHDEYYIMSVLSYSWRHKAFNAFDSLPTSENRIESVTHWMPLPEPPKEDERDD